MPCDLGDHTIYPARLPLHVPWKHQVKHTPTKDPMSTEEISYYRLPASDHTFWMNFRVARFQHNGILRSDAVTVDLRVLTSTGWLDIFRYASCHPRKWYSTRWPIPAIPMTDGGIYLCIHTNDHLIVELQGFHHAYPPSRQYILMDGPRPHLLFLQEGRIGSVHAMDQEEHTEQFPQEYDLIPLQPLSLPAHI